MKEHEGRIAAFLSNTPWNGAIRTKLAGDASKRRYERLIKDGNSSILMVAPPETGEDTCAFLRIGRHLSASGFSAPNILATDEEAGLILLEDLGDAIFAKLAATDPVMERKLYEAAVDMLVALHQMPPPDALQPMTAKGLAEATDLAWVWYAGFGDGIRDHDVEARLAGLFEMIPSLSEVLVLRDFHAENLIWLKDRNSHARVGLLDFQDALLGHRTYDLVSLIYDARREPSAGIASAMIERYAAAAEADHAMLGHACAAFRLQRNLRILGIFARLSLRDGKASYLKYLPCVWRHVTEALEHPELSFLKVPLLASLPPPNPNHLARLSPR